MIVSNGLHSHKSCPRLIIRTSVFTISVGSIPGNQSVTTSLTVSFLKGCKPMAHSPSVRSRFDEQRHCITSTLAVTCVYWGTIWQITRCHGRCLTSVLSHAIAHHDSCSNQRCNKRNHLPNPSIAFHFPVPDSSRQNVSTSCDRSIQVQRFPAM